MNTPTLRDVARAAGVSLATASYAMRRHPTVSTATHQRVADAAAKVGYRLNPQLAAFMQARRVGRSMRADATIGLVYGSAAGTLRGNHYFGHCVAGLRAVAAERGYRIDAIRCHPTRPGEAARLQRVLDQRGIRGLVLVPPDGAGSWNLPLDWTRFFGVTWDYSLTEPSAHRVMDHHASDFLLALGEVRKAGYQRPGLVLNPLNNARTRDLRVGAFLAQAARETGDSVPPLVIEGDPSQPRRLRAWIAAHRPDVILSPDPIFPFADGVLAGAGGRKAAPAFVGLAQYVRSPEMAAIVVDAEGIGRTAGFLLMSLLENSGMAGFRRQTLLVESAWANGASLPTIVRKSI